MKTRRLVTGSLAALALVFAGCSGHNPVPTQTVQPRTPQSVSPGTIKPAPMAKTTVLPSSAMATASSSRKPMAAINGLSFSQIPGAASYAAAASDGSLWVLSTQPAGADKYIWHYVNGTWTNISGLASRIAVAPNGTLFAINSGGGAYSYANGAWSAFGGGCRDLTAASDGTLYVISNGGGPDGAIWHYASGAWAQMPGSGNRLAASWDSGYYTIAAGAITPGGFYVINSIGSIYYLGSSGYVQLPGAASAVAPINGGLFALGYPADPNGNVLFYYDLASPGWNTKGGSGVSVSSDGTNLYVIGASGGIYTSKITVASTPAPNVAFLNSAGQGLINGTSTSATLVAISGFNTPENSSSATLPNGSISVTVGTNTTPLSRARKLDIRSMNSADGSANPRLFHDLDLPQLDLQKLRASARRVSAQSVVRGTKSFTPPAIGTQKNFNVLGGSISAGIGGNTSVAFTMQAIGQHGYIWMDNTLSSTVVGYAGRIAAIFDSSWASNTAKFGPAQYTTTSAGYAAYAGSFSTCDSTGKVVGTADNWFIDPTANDGKINVLVVNSANPALGSGVGGYFAASNFLRQGMLNCQKNNTTISNEQPEILVGWYGQNGDTYELQEDLVRGTAHELQHLINYTNHVIINNGGHNDPRWLNEGLSVLAQDLVTPGNFDVDDAMWRASGYLAHPEQYSLTGFRSVTGTSSTYNCSYCYGFSYLFARYMYDRFGPSFTTSMTQGSTYGSDSLLRISGEDMPSLINDFATALANSGTGISSDPRYNFGSSGLNLRGTYNSPYGFGPLTLTGPAAFATLPAGQSLGVTTVPAGSLVFFSASPVNAAGSAVKLVDTTTTTPSPMLETGVIVQK